MRLYLKNFIETIRKKLFIYLVRKNSTYDLITFNQELANFILSRLNIMKRNCNSHPSNVENLAEWKKILDQICNTFLIIREGKDKGYTFEDFWRIQTGLNLFNKYILNFW